MCGAGLLAGGAIVAYRVRIDQMVAAPQAIREACAMDMMFPGAPGVARAFSDGEVLSLASSEDRLLCQACFLGARCLDVFAPESGAGGGE